ncbi:MAG: acyltransferase family protein [Candidatus Dormibacteraeota bacterium]|uniref:Acyltransferase family protein n=1 Tax=Candidatus Aeolococcus gillhamiae TaxID=3127015 RepID=A0A934JUH6_9BACT|nr:acyltransferase family protein [Candidatus Dormibacteraeota bacterium]
MTRAASARPSGKRTSSNGHRPHRSADLKPVATAPRRRVPAVAPSPPRWFTRPSRPSLPSLSSLSGLTALLPTDRLSALRRDLPATAMAATGMLALRLRELTGRDLMDLESLQELMSVYYRLAAVREQHANNQYDIDDFGFDREWTEALMPIFRVVARRYWRVELEGTENIPRSGGALLVSNHAGVLPWDGAMIKVAVFDAVDRHARALIATWFGELPVASWFLRRTGQTLGHPDDTLRLLRAGEMVLVFPEGVRGTGKPWNERYRLRRFGRGGFVEVARRAGVPIVPISVVGSEETYPMIADIRSVAQTLGMPYFPITPTWPLLGPLGLLPLPSKWLITFHPPVAVSAGTAADPGSVMEMADSIRATVQDGVVENLMRRQRVFRG